MSRKKSGGENMSRKKSGSQKMYLNKIRKPKNVS